MDGHEQDFQIEQERPPSDVVEIILNTLPQGGPTSPSVDLGPTRHSDGHGVAKLVVGDFGTEFLDEDWSLGARPDEAHITDQDVEQLRKFVDIRMTKPVADPRTATIVILGPDRASLGLRVGLHAAEFNNAEFSSALAHPFLSVENGATRSDEYQGRNDEKQRRQQHQTQRSPDDIRQPLGVTAESLTERWALNCPKRFGVERIVSRLRENLVHPVNTDFGGGLGEIADLTLEPRCRAMRECDDEICCARSIDEFRETVNRAKDRDGFSARVNDELSSSPREVHKSDDRDSRETSLAEAACQVTDATTSTDQKQPTLTMTDWGRIFPGWDFCHSHTDPSVMFSEEMTGPGARPYLGVISRRDPAIRGRSSESSSGQSPTDLSDSRNLSSSSIDRSDAHFQ